jgi:ribonucleoside-diphosphate reductase beta chain
MALRQTTYGSTVGLRMDTVPWRLWQKSKDRFWDPDKIDYSQDAKDWGTLDDEERRYLKRLGTLFMVGEESVTLDILPLVRAIADQGRLEETMYLTMFAMEEAKHIEFFRRWFNALGEHDGFTDELTPAYRKIFDDELPQVLRRLDTDPSNEAVLDAAVTYNQFIEGVLALTGYHSWDRALTKRDLMPGMRAGLVGIQRDERRHMAYGTFLCRRIVAEEPHLWDFVQSRMQELQATTIEFLEEGRTMFSEPYPFGIDPDSTMEYALTQVPRRLEVIEVAAKTSVSEVETSTVEEELEDELERV